MRALLQLPRALSSVFPRAPPRSASPHVTRPESAAGYYLRYAALLRAQEVRFWRRGTIWPRTWPFELSAATGRQDSKRTRAHTARIATARSDNHGDRSVPWRGLRPRPEPGSSGEQAPGHLRTGAEGVLQRYGSVDLHHHGIASRWLHCTSEWYRLRIAFISQVGPAEVQTAADAPRNVAPIALLAGWHPDSRPGPSAGRCRGLPEQWEELSARSLGP